MPFLGAARGMRWGWGGPYWREQGELGCMSLLTSCCFTKGAPAPHGLLEVEEPAQGL